MDSLLVRSLLAGIFFGLWPIMMNRSKFTGNASAAMFAGVIFAVVILPAFFTTSRGMLLSANWKLGVLAGLFGAAGLMAFNSMLAKSTPERLGTLFLVNLVTQITTAAVFQVVATRTLTLSKGLGFASAILTVWLLV